MKKIFLIAMSCATIYTSVNASAAWWSKDDVSHSYVCKDLKNEVKDIVLNIGKNQFEVYVDSATLRDIDQGKKDLFRSDLGDKYRFYKGSNYFSLSLPLEMVENQSQSGIVLASWYMESATLNCQLIKK